jgi:anti-anti-sigma regulatory factor
MKTSSSKAEVLRSDEAAKVIETEKDPITRALLNNANFWFMKKFFEQNERPVSDFDLHFFINVLREVFAEHDVLRRMLAGEKVGQFFEDPSESGGDLQIEVAGNDPRQLILHGRIDVTTAPKLHECISSIIAQNYRRIELECRYLAIRNAWVVFLLAAIGENARRHGAEILFSGIEDDWFKSLLRTHKAPGNVDHSLKDLFAAYLDSSKDRK